MRFGRNFWGVLLTQDHCVLQDIFRDTQPNHILRAKKRAPNAVFDGSYNNDDIYQEYKKFP